MTTPRSGLCVGCGVAVALHYDEHNVKLSCDEARDRHFRLSDVPTDPQPSPIGAVLHTLLGATLVSTPSPRDDTGHGSSVKSQLRGETRAKQPDWLTEAIVQDVHQERGTAKAIAASLG